MMKEGFEMKKYLMIIVSVLLVLALVAGCAAETPKQEDEKEPTPEPTQDEPAGFYVEYNGQKLALGMKFADVKDKLGEEVRPEDVITPCDESDLYRDVLHHFEGLDITENKDGVIKEISTDNADEAAPSSATINGKVKIGDTLESAVSVLGENEDYPLAEDMFGLTYTTDSTWVTIFVDETKTNVTGFYFMPFGEGW